MKTLKDKILEQAQNIKNFHGTEHGMELLELSNESKHYYAGNMYLSALGIIADLQTKLLELEKEN